MQVLRHCDSPVVRELAVQCIGQAISMHPKALGSGDALDCLLWCLVERSLRVRPVAPLRKLCNGLTPLHHL